MTICEKIGNFQTSIRRRNGFLGTVAEDVELDIKWVSCGLYQIRVNRLKESLNIHIEPKTGFSFQCTAGWFGKVLELYPADVKPSRMESHKPFYEEFVPDPGMFDMGQDLLIQAFKDQFEERVILSNTHFECGQPMSINSLLMGFDEVKRLKEYLDNPNGKGNEIFYSGCQIDWSKSPALKQLRGEATE